MNEHVEVNPLELSSRKEMDRQWFYVSEYIRRLSTRNAEARKILIQFCTQPVSDDLPQLLLVALSEIDETIGKLYARFGDTLGKYLQQPPYPKEKLIPDLSTSPGLNYRQRDLVAARYVYARDVKLLALGAEILEHGGVTSMDQSEIQLPSGVRLFLDETEFSDSQEFTNPHEWRRKRQIKDRVHEITVGDARFILKERKTAQHTDTKRKGHIDGNSSPEEFAIAKHFSQVGRMQEREVRVDWEKALGYVVFPDGFQFTLFEVEKLVDKAEIFQVLVQGILTHRSQFDAEYQDLLIHLHDADLSQLYSRGNTILARSGSQNTLSFEQFATANAYVLRDKAVQLFEKVLYERLGYAPNDLDGFGFTIDDEEGRIFLRIIGFDFEYYYKPESSSLQGIRERKSRQLKSNLMLGLGLKLGKQLTEFEEAAYFSLLERENMI